MIGLFIGAAELAEIEAGAPCIVLAPGVVLRPAPPLVPLVLRDGVLARPDADVVRRLPLPGWVRPLALVAPDALADRLRAMLPAGLAVVADASTLPALLAGALRAVTAERDAAAAARDRLARALGAAAPLARRVLDLPPGGAVATLPATQPLGIPAEGLCGIELHVAAAGAGGLRVRLLAGARVAGIWQVPAAAIVPGWLALDLPEPAPAGSAAAVLEVTGEADAPALSASGADPAAPLALRAGAAPPGWSVLPLHFDWAAQHAPHPAIPLSLPEAVLRAAEVLNAGVELIGAGEEPARLLLAIPAGATARLALPPVPVAAADLLRARLVLRGRGDGVSASVSVGAVASDWRPVDPDAAFALPLPPGGMAGITVACRNAGAVAAAVELATLALAAGAAGEPRRAPAPQAAPARIAMPGGALGADAGRRSAGPVPRLAASAPGGRPAAASSAPAGFQEVRLNQYMVTADGGYRHLDIGITGLVSGGGLWRQVRLKLFERRGTPGLEFREAKGWPPMFDVWPPGGSDDYGPFWRLDAAGALGALATPHDRALVAAVVDILPDLAARGADLATLPAKESAAWVARARRLAAAVTGARAD